MVNLSSVRRRVVLAGIAATMSLGGLAAGVAPASASAAGVAPTSAVAVPATAQGCTGDSCIRVNNPSGGKVEIQGWAYNRTFFGHFELQGPGGLTKNSTSDKSWQAGGGSNELDRATFNVAAVVGKYCMTAWEYMGSSGYLNLGKACRSVE